MGLKMDIASEDGIEREKLALRQGSEQSGATPY
jgi:hypothetical protein